MRYCRSQQNIVWTVLFLLFTTLSLNSCSDANNVTGPPPPVPLSPDAKLSSLTVNTGPLDPVFSVDIANNAVNVATSVGSVTVTARPQNTNASMTINGQATPSGQARTITLGTAGLNTLIPIVVTAVSGSQNTYFVTVNRLGANNANLLNLTVTPVNVTGFNPANTGPYPVDVNSTVGSVTVTATKADASATVFINGVVGTSRTINLPAAPSSTEVNVQVNAQDGTTTKIYEVEVNRLPTPASTDAGLSSLTVSTGTLVPDFVAPGTSGSPGYTVTVLNVTTSITVTAVKADSSAILTISPSSTVNDLQVGNTDFTIVVTAQAGNVLTYFVTVIREP